MVESVLSYGCEIWFVSAEMKRRLQAEEMDHLIVKRSAKTSSDIR